MTSDRQAKEQLLNLQLEASGLYRAGHTRQQVVAEFLSRGMPQELAEVLADSGIAGQVQERAYGERKDSEIDDELLEHAKEVAYRIDEGKSKSEIMAWLMQQEMPVSLAENIIGMGVEILRDMVQRNRSAVMRNGMIFAGVGIAVAVGGYVTEAESTLLYVAAFGSMALGARVFHNGYRQSAARLPHWPHL